MGETHEEMEAKILSGEYQIVNLTHIEQIALTRQLFLTVDYKKIRKEMGISQRELAELCEVKQPVIARIERMDAVPRLDTFIKMLAPMRKMLYIGDER